LTIVIKRYEGRSIKLVGGILYQTSRAGQIREAVRSAEGIVNAKEVHDNRPEQL